MATEYYFSNLDEKIMPNPNLSDYQAKTILRGWPTRTKKLWKTPKNQGFWMQAQPVIVGASAPSPTIRLPGANLFTTQPDGMWIYLSASEFADVMCIEVCREGQNLNDKRSRYMSAVRSLVLYCPLTWLTTPIRIQRGGQAPRWEACRTLAAMPSADLSLPIRHLRVLYALQDSLYRTWSDQNVPGGHEYFCRHSSLGSYNGPAMQKFLRHMSLASHFYTRMGR